MLEGTGQRLYDAVRRWHRGPTWKRNAFNGDAIESGLVVRLVRQLAMDAIVETGTYLGHTTYFLASEFPRIPIETYEVDPTFCDRARRNLAACRNVVVRQGDSASLITSASGGRNTMFYLDAHWYAGSPLRAEVGAIVGRGPAVIVIDDFKVPGRPDYAFALAEGAQSSFAPEYRGADPLGLPGALDLDTIAAHLDRDRHTVLFPRYSYDDLSRVVTRPRFQNLVGYCVVLQDQEPVAMARLLALDHVSRYFRVHPLE